MKKEEVTEEEEGRTKGTMEGEERGGVDRMEMKEDEEKGGGE